jgi:hypothetical protein
MTAAEQLNDTVLGRTAAHCARQANMLVASCNQAAADLQQLAVSTQQNRSCIASLGLPLSLLVTLCR